MQIERFDELKLSGRLPSPSGVGLRLLQLSQAEDVTLDDVVAILATDPTLTGRLLKLANSASSTGVRPATTAKEAALRLGLRTVFAVSLSFSLVASNREGHCPAFDYDAYWSRSLAAASAAQALATLTGELPPSEAFTAALLARIGRLALASIHPEGYAEVLEGARGHGTAALIEAEREAFGTDHLELGAALLADWRVPAPIVEAASLGGATPPDNSSKAVRAHCRHLGMAQDIARALVSPATAPPSHCAARLAELTRVRDQLGHSVQAFDQFWNECVALWREWGSQMRVPASPELNLAELAERASQTSLESAPEIATGPRGVVPADDGNAAPKESRNDAATPLTVLVVEDDPVALRVLVAQLNREGHTVLTATDGRAGLAEAMQSSPDVVVTDWMMPELDGVDMTRSLRQSSYGQQVHVILMTGRDEDARVVEAFEGGVDEYLTKPLNARVLMARVRAAGRTIGLRRQVQSLLLERERQLAEQAILSRKLQVASLTDPLTGLPNRRCAMERLAREAKLAIKNGSTFSVVMLDIDRFKSVNDTYGHDAGDVVLKEVSQVLRQGVRRGDLICRLGGEEFLAVCPNAEGATAAAIAERVRALVAATTIHHPRFQGSITISAGVAVWGRDGADVDALLQGADKRLYMAKNSGRNCVVSDGPLAQAG
ncbi:MAG: diguanylate cyclase [Planctomycetaceae bacterium]|nr:diguanylate cyclase [Planctomycetaceae bacterium]